MNAILTILAIVSLLFAGIWAAKKIFRPSTNDSPAFPMLSGVFLAVAAGLFALNGMILQVPANSAAVIENTATGEYSQVGPGITILTPFVTRSTIYDLRKQIIEIGDQPAGEALRPTNEIGVESSSNSPGRPTVYFKASGWASPNPAALIKLHTQFGEGYKDTWVERNWISALKEVQGTLPFDYVGTNRQEFADKVEEALQKQLTIDGVELVFVSQLTVVDYDYKPETKASLAKVSDIEFKRKEAVSQLETNKAQQEAEKIAAQTRFLVTQKESETQAEQLRISTQANANKKKIDTQAEAEARIIEAKSIADAEVAKAEGEAKATRLKMEAQAYGVQKVREAVGTSQDFVEWERANKWNGQLPSSYYSGNNGPIPIISEQKGEQKPQ